MPDLPRVTGPSETIKDHKRSSRWATFQLQMWLNFQIHRPWESPKKLRSSCAILPMLPMRQIGNCCLIEGPLASILLGNHCDLHSMQRWIDPQGHSQPPMPLKAVSLTSQIKRISLTVDRHLEAGGRELSKWFDWEIQHGTWPTAEDHWLAESTAYQGLRLPTGDWGFLQWVIATQHLAFLRGLKSFD